jgi:uncharacterized protein YwbE
MGATLVLAKKEVYPSGLVVEAVIWQLPEKTADRPHGLKYRLYCGRTGKCIVRYDNETGKGDHVHYDNVEKPYLFLTLRQLVQDFYADIERLTGERP